MTENDTNRLTLWAAQEEAVVVKRFAKFFAKNDENEVPLHRHYVQAHEWVEGATFGVSRSGYMSMALLEQITRSLEDPRLERSLQRTRDRHKADSEKEANTYIQKILKMLMDDEGMGYDDAVATLQRWISEFKDAGY